MSQLKTEQIETLNSETEWQDPMDLLTAEQIDKVLTETFNRLDNDGSGELEILELRKAWEFLGLKGSRTRNWQIVRYY